MEMQDNEFDKVFNSKFEDFEMEPSPAVWDNIAGELDGKKAKRSIIPWLSIAASIIVVFTAGILFLKQKDKTDDQPNKPGKLVANHIQPANTVTENTDTEPVVITKPNNRVASTKGHIAVSVTPDNSKITAPVNTKTNDPIKETEPVKTADQPLLAAAVTHDAIQSVVPGKEIQLAPKTSDIEQQTREKPAVVATVTKPNVSLVKKRGIHNLGGLINVLVAKVDKRQDKLIEFTDSDDDDTESNVTGVNLGIIKIKKQ